MKAASIVFLALAATVASLMAIPLFYGIIYADKSKSDDTGSSEGSG